MTQQQSIKLRNLKTMERALFKQRDKEPDPDKRERIEDQIESVQAEIEKLEGKTA